MRLNKRQEDLLRYVQRESSGTVEGLANLFEVTQQTIRRDVLQLESLGLVSRFHGGVRVASDTENLAYSARQTLFSTEKRRIAELVADQIPDRASILVGLGTTAEAVAGALFRRKGLRVVTNNLNVAATMCDYPDAEVIVVGGIVRPRDRGVTGEAALDAIRQTKVDYAIVGVSSIGLDGTLRDFDHNEVRATQAIMGQARRIYLVADHSKFGRPALVKLGHLQQVDALFTDAPVPTSLAPVFREGKPALHVAAA